MQSMTPNALYGVRHTPFSSLLLPAEFHLLDFTDFAPHIFHNPPHSDPVLRALTMLDRDRRMLQQVDSALWDEALSSPTSTGRYSPSLRPRSSVTT